MDKTAYCENCGTEVPVDEKGNCACCGSKVDLTDHITTK